MEQIHLNIIPFPCVDDDDHNDDNDKQGVSFDLIDIQCD